MSVYAIDHNGISTRLSSLAQQLDATFLRVQQFKIFLDTISDANLTSLYAFPQADIDIMRSALNDIEQLRTIYQGTVNLAVSKDFRAFAKQVYAFGSF